MTMFCYNYFLDDHIMLYSMKILQDKLSIYFTHRPTLSLPFVTSNKIIVLRTTAAFDYIELFQFCHYYWCEHVNVVIGVHVYMCVLQTSLMLQVPMKHLPGHRYRTRH